MELWYALVDLLPFDWAQPGSMYFMKNALLAVLVISPLFGVLSTMVVHSRMSFFSDALGHSAFTGIAIGTLCGLADPLWMAVLLAAVFALLFSVNFSVYFLVLHRRLKEALKSDELRFFLGVVAAATVVITLDLLPIYQNTLESLRYAFFQVASIISTTGFATADYVLWPQLSRLVLVLLMFCGACAGSTGGAIKCSRVLLLLKCIRREIRQVVHPRSVNVVKLDGRVVDEDSLRSVQLFFAAYLFIALGATLLVSVDNFSFGTTFTAVVSCIGNVGHSWQMVAQTCSPLAHKGLLTAAKVMALACVRTMDRPDVIEAAKKEVTKRNGGHYPCPLR